MQAADRRRLNPPAGGTAPPVFVSNDRKSDTRTRTRKPDEHRKIFLQTGIVPSAAGSSYYELPPEHSDASSRLAPAVSSLKITCTVHGPRPLPRNAAFSPNLLLSTHVKFAPFATSVRRGYVRDVSERDLGVHLETALRGVVIGERWPKAAADVVVTILEGEEEGTFEGKAADGGNQKGWGMMSVLAGCITAASAAIVDAGIDCVDFVTGGVAAIEQELNGDAAVSSPQLLVDPAPSEQPLSAACVVAYLQTRDEVTEMWLKGDVGMQTDALIDQAVRAASLARTVLVETTKESVETKYGDTPGATNGEAKTGKGKEQQKDVLMTG